MSGAQLGKRTVPMASNNDDDVNHGKQVARIKIHIETDELEKLGIYLIDGRRSSRLADWPNHVDDGQRSILFFFDDDDVIFPPIVHWQMLELH